MRLLLLTIAATIAVTAAAAQTPADSNAVTVLRGASAPPPIITQPIVINLPPQQQLLGYGDYLPPYYGYPYYFVPVQPRRDGFMHQRPFVNSSPATMPTQPLPNGFPLLNTGRR
jgi:hypothetical protein